MKSRVTKNVGPLFSMEQNLANNPVRRMMRELKDRTQAVIKMVPYIAAKDLYDQLQLKIPDQPSYRKYKLALRINKIGGLDKKTAGYTVSVPVMTDSRRDVTPNTVIYIRAKKVLKNVPAKIKLLEEHGPWTADTIPFWPKVTEAVIIKRKVSKREADKVSKLQLEPLQQKKIRDEFFKIGMKNLSNVREVQNRNTGYSDIVATGMTLEFGGLGGKTMPIWRESIYMFRKEGIKNMDRSYPAFKEALTSPSSYAWKKFPPNLKIIKSAQLGSFTNFIKKLGY
jgi:hypothetical protein